VAPKIQLQDNASGSVWVWTRPKPGKLYTIGVDTSAGVRGGDQSVAQVVEMDSCEQVAEMAGWWEPYKFGRMVARLGWVFNEAEVGIETHPSAHGIACYDSAVAYGYANLFQQQSFDSREAKFLIRKGWSSAGGGSEVLLNRVRVAVTEGVKIRSERLLNQLLGARYGDDDRLDRYCKNDLIVALGIALKVRDIAYRDGRVPAEKARALDETERFWLDYAVQDRQAAKVGPVTEPQDPNFGMYGSSY
jgi:hypothetical protein